jgi:5-methylcytosine-specific restriction protein B
MNNGISSRGQSVLSLENFNRFTNDSPFIDTLTELIKLPNRYSFNRFSEAWDKTRVKYGANRNPLLINRTVAACTTDVTSTVNEPDFETAYQWLVREKLITIHPDAESDWYDKNVLLMDRLKTEFAQEIEQGGTSMELLSIFIWELSQNVANPFSLKKQLIRYGAPGTGKTYTAQRDTELLFEIWNEQFDTQSSLEEHLEIVQFHPSFGYEDFMEGLRPALNPEGIPQLVLQNGVFKNACIRAARWEIDVYNLPKIGPSLAKRWESLTLGDLKSYKGQLNGSHWDFLHSHPHTDKRIGDLVPPYFFIIDEINRAELSRVLGELMFSLEYRGAKGAISTQYSTLNTEDTGMISIAGVWKFFIPHNLFIIGTMNTIDRSVESFDLALRRRFRWERVNPDINALRYHLRQRDTEKGIASRPWEGLADDLDRLNQQIRTIDLLGEDYEVGHAYLMNLSYPQNLTRSDVRQKAWDDSIRPLMEEYLRGSGLSETLIPALQKSFGIS